MVSLSRGSSEKSASHYYYDHLHMSPHHDDNNWRARYKIYYNIYCVRSRCFYNIIERFVTTVRIIGIVYENK